MSIYIYGKTLCMKNNICTKIWHIPHLFGRVTPGVLQYKNGRIAFVTTGGLQFDVVLSELSRISYPLLRMGMGFNATIHGKTYKFSFAKPNPNAPDIYFQKGNPYPIVTAEIDFLEDWYVGDIKQNKEIAREWKQLLKNTN